MEGSGLELDLPGFRFHPTEAELLDFYLRRMVQGMKLNFNVIGTINLYRYDPWELPGLAKIGEREWYFFVPRDRRQSSGGRPNRTTERGYWKATGSDRHIRSSSDLKRIIGLKKTLVFYKGRAPRGSKTDWVMNEYRLPEATSSSSIPPPKEDIVLCKIYRKAMSLKELEQRAAMEKEAAASACIISTPTSVTDATSSSDLDYNHQTSRNQDVVNENELAITGEVFLQEKEEREIEMSSSPTTSNDVRSTNLAELEVPKHGMEWMQDAFLTQLRSPWLDQWSPYAHLLNF